MVLRTHATSGSAPWIFIEVSVDMDTAPQPMRIVVIGTSCAGKSTFARSLAGAMLCTRIELDELHWGPNWQAKPTQVFHELVANAIAGERWVADGNYSAIRELLWQNATTIVWLNYSYPRTLWQAFKRTTKRAWNRELLWHGNRESMWHAFFTRESILYWVATTYHRRKREFEALRQGERFAHLVWYEFRHPKQAQQWLANRRSAS